MRLGAAFVAAVLIFTVSTNSVTSSPAHYEEPPKKAVVTRYQDPDSEAWLWDRLMEYTGGDAKITAGILGYYWRESFLKSNATAHWATVNPYLGRDMPVEFTARIDAGLADGSTRDDFIESVREQIGGYGLGQWYSRHYLEDLYDFAQAWGTSIGDADMQCAFTVRSMQAEDGLWAYLEAAEDAYSAGLVIAYRYDGLTGDYAEGLAGFAREFYEKYAEVTDG
jgi:hypothetical protein